mmetsp:Transcript_11342/g.22450  ORF Transcript_11342/g.22450 Transcript_11342/m.22450 type:complete len:394 (-) Transcript_11342:508-1689(-)
MILRTVPLLARAAALLAGANPALLVNLHSGWVPDSIFETSLTMIAASNVMYSDANLRLYVRQVPFIHSNSSSSTDEEVKNLRREILRNAPMSSTEHFRLMNRMAQISPPAARADHTRAFEFFKGKSWLGDDKSGVLYYCGDSNADRIDSCVYSLLINRTKKRITLVFRGTEVGSNVIAQMKTNFDAMMRWEENRNDEMLDTIPAYSVHSGFSRALMGRRRKIILKIAEMREAYPETKNYPLFVTGHSLGGALATLFGVYAATYPEITAAGPVQLYTFGAPSVGGKQFGTVFKYLEETNRIRCARLFNRYDPVPKGFDGIEALEHVGKGIQFSEQEWVSHNNTSGNMIQTLAMMTKNFNKLWDSHTLDRVYDNVENNEESLKITLDELYARDRK